MGPLLGMAVSKLASSGLEKLFGGGDDMQKLNLDAIRKFQAPTQGLIDEQLGISRQMMDPQSAINMQMRNLMAQEEAKNNIGSSGYVSVDAMADTTPDVGFVPDNYTPDLGGYIGAIDDDGLPNVDVNESDFIDDPYAIDIQDTNIYTENPDGTYTVEDGEPDPIDVFDPNKYIDSSGNGDGGGTATTTTNTATQRTDPYEYFNLYRSTAPSSWLRNSIYNAYGTGPDFDVDVYQAADGSLRFTETDQLVPEEYLKYIPYARRTEMDAPVEEEA